MDQEKRSVTETNVSDETATSTDGLQQGTRGHGNAESARSGWGQMTEGDPNQRGTHGHPQDESLRNGTADSLGRNLENRPGSHGQMNEEMSGTAEAPSHHDSDDGDDAGSV